MSIFLEARHKWCRLLGVAALSILAAMASLIVRGEPRPEALRHGAAPVVPTGPPADYLSRLPVAFEPNRGQAPPNVHFVAQTGGYRTFLLSDGIVLGPSRGCEQPLRVRFAGKRRPSVPHTLNELPGRSNYYPTRHPSTWRAGIPQYSRVEYPGLYPGIDLAVEGLGSELEYDWLISPGADPNDIEVRFEPAKSLRLGPEGDVFVRTPCGELQQRLPFAYQYAHRQRRAVPARYSIRSSNTVGISVGDYDRKAPLVIDPSISIAVLVGSSGKGLSQDSAAAVALGPDGSIYLTGTTWAADFPHTSGSFGGESDLFVLRLNSSGSSLLYSTVMGSTGGESGLAIAVDRSGNAYATGVTTDTILKLDPTGALLYRRSFAAPGQAIALDGSGNIFLAGRAESPNFPTTSGAFQRSFGGGPSDGFVAKFSNEGTLLASTFLGGRAEDNVQGIAVDAAGNVYATGSTSSSDFPTTAGAFQRTLPEGRGSFLTKLNSSLSSTIYSTFFPGVLANAIAVDSSGSAFLTGLAGSSLPLANALQPRIGGSPDAFLTKFSPDGSQLIFSTYLGGKGNDEGRGVAVDTSGYAYVTGSTASSDFPQLDPLQAEIDGGNCTALVGGCGDSFIAKIRPDGSGLVYSTFLGGDLGEVGTGITADVEGNAYVTGGWGSRGFPATALANLSKGRGAFIVKIAPTGSTPLISARGVTNGASFQAGTVSGSRGAPIGGIVTIFGKGITNVSGILTASTLPLPTELNGISVTINGVRAPLFAIANVSGQEQINFQLPATTLSPFALSVFNNGAQAIPIALNSLVAQPGIFTTDGTTGAIQHSSTYQQVTAGNPAKRGEVLVIYATGLGPVNPDPGPGNPAPSSPPSQTVTVTTRVTIGGVPAQVLFSGLAPGFVGLNQVNVVVPQGTASGTVDVIVTSTVPSGIPIPVSSPAVKLAVE